MQRSERGFTLIELMMVVLIFGLMMAFAVPSVARLGQTHNLIGAKEDMMAQLAMSRAKAIATGIPQPFHCYAGTYGYDYHVHVAPMSGWKLPRGVTYDFALGSDMNVTWLADGRADAGLVIPLKNTKGQRDTINVLASGMIISQ